ncbi:AsmA-like C-terminal region-containing protein [Variovorax sp. J2P1-59]|uniref:AsmA-like C-terminal region-containing protein n=1 Tax=Variovorax flavidus TaxID=3053501 RepID=UPI002578F236|nr:AsmA-like C-terminal region-containing protein [Variovorax sp. J2P1-59]MDM0075367.1 AsmA-like C-terminal region-containing protein [Variovorax sp. J2P1-59]
MTRARRWIAGSLAAAALLLAGLAVLVSVLLPSDEQLAADLGGRFEKASGIGLRIGAAHWALRPSPVVVLEDLSTAQPQPITVRRIVVRPHLSALWTRRIAVDTVEIDGAVLPRTSVRAFRGRWQADDAAVVVAGAWTLAEIPVEHVRLRDVVWIDRRDIALAYDADVRFDPHWRPREGQLSRPGVTPPASLRIEREGAKDRWRTLIDVGGGTWNGNAELQELDKGRLRLTAQLEPKNVDVGALVRSFGRHSAVEGKLQGQSAVDAEGDNLTELVGALHTRTRFSIVPATLAGFDLARMVSTGSGRGGQTKLDSLTGTLDTQATEDGAILRYSGMKARSGALTASGSATVINRRLDGEVAVDIVDGVVGVPLKLGGSLDAPQLSLTGAALTGAAVGTAVLPGVGTAIGARIGQEMDKLLGNEDAKKKQKPR